MSLENLYTHPTSAPAAPPPAETSARFVHDSDGSLRDLTTGARAPAADPQQEGFADRENRIGSRLFGASNTTKGDPVTALEIIGAEPDADTKAIYAEAGLSVFGGACDNDLNRRATSAAIDIVSPGVSTAAKAAISAEYVRYASLVGIEPQGHAEIAKEFSRVYAEGNAPTAETVASWDRANRAAVAQLGPQANAVVAEAKRLMASDPRGYKMLLKTGMVANPVLVRNALRAAAAKLRVR